MVGSLSSNSDNKQIEKGGKIFSVNRNDAYILCLVLLAFLDLVHPVFNLLSSKVTEEA